MGGHLGPAKGKDFDTGNAIGPWLVTPDELPDPYALTMVARVNGAEWSRGSTAEMHWRFEDLIAHISAAETLYPGDFIGSGTVGRGCGLEHGAFLAPATSSSSRSRASACCATAWFERAGLQPRSLARAPSPSSPPLSRCGLVGMVAPIPWVPRRAVIARRT